MSFRSPKSLKCCEYVSFDLQTPIKQPANSMLPKKNQVINSPLIVAMNAIISIGIRRILILILKLAK